MTTRRAGTGARTFVFRGGVRIAGTVIACDAVGGADLTFLSGAESLHAGATRAPRPARSRAPAPVRAQVLVTEPTLALLGDAALSFRERALVTPLGRPFTLGAVRVEIIPSGTLAGAAALSCEVGDRRILYAGAARLGDATLGAEPGAVRAAQALCLDATFGHPRYAFATRGQALATLCEHASDARARGLTPVVLVAPIAGAVEAAVALAAAGWRLRAHATLAAAVAAYARTGMAVPPIGAVPTGALASDELLLWPETARAAARLGRVGSPHLIWLSGAASDPAARGAMGAHVSVAYGNRPDHAQLWDYVRAIGAREVGTLGAHAEDFATELRARGLRAYSLAPPRQIGLFGATPSDPASAGS